MKRSERTRLRVKIRTPGGRNVYRFKQRRVGHATCGKCGCKLNRARLTKIQVKKLTKVQKRPSRPYPELCSKCMRLKIKGMLK
ncbi:MAG: 50S ribosomal protein L34e [Candidatus Aenigmarchaeota archaeon]|nr:50S ribosomal protein L34e [Candidatus Aenigmarchaeota archaeon]